jgi:hypothetical protein
MVRVDTLLAAQPNLLHTKRISKPTGLLANEEGDAFGHPAIGFYVAQSSRPELGVNERVVPNDGSLPERAAHDCPITALNVADSQERQLRIGTACYD